MNWKNAFCLSVVIIVAGSCACCIDVGGTGSDDLTITLYGFSVKGEVFEERIIPAFREKWKEESGETVEFRTCFAGSGKITNQVLNGAPAEVMILSTEWDALQLRHGGMVETDWRDMPYNGTVSTSPWVILVRGGNPEEIEDFEDLTGDGVELVHADPVTSGGACWSVFSVYGSAHREAISSGSDDPDGEAEEILKDISGNVISWQSSARKALSQFTMGYGDCLITYENDALLSIEKGEDLEIVYPYSTILSEHKAVLVDENVNDKERKMVLSFMDFLFSEEVQGYMVDYNFRSMMDGFDYDRPMVEDPFTVEYLGGWESARSGIIDGVFKDIRG